MKRNVRKPVALLAALAMLMTMLFSVIVVPMMSSAAEDTVAEGTPATPDDPFHAWAATSVPDVENKIDILDLAGWGQNYQVQGWARVGTANATLAEDGTVSAPVLAGPVDLTEMHYLYYSIDQAADAKFTFGINLSNPWFLYRDGSVKDSPAMSSDDTKFNNQAEVFVAGPETGCVDITGYMSTDEDAAPITKELIKAVTVYCEEPGHVLNYLFLGSAPKETPSDPQPSDPSETESTTESSETQPSEPQPNDSVGLLPASSEGINQSYGTNGGVTRVEFNEDGSFKLIRDASSAVDWPSMEYRYADPLTVNLDKTPNIHLNFVTSEGGGQGVNGFIVYTVAGGAEQTLQLSQIGGRGEDDFRDDTDETYDLKGALGLSGEISITAIRLSVYGTADQYVVWKALEFVPAETEPSETQPSLDPDVQIAVNVYEVAAGRKPLSSLDQATRDKLGLAEDAKEVSLHAVYTVYLEVAGMDKLTNGSLPVPTETTTEAPSETEPSEPSETEPSGEDTQPSEPQTGDAVSLLPTVTEQDAINSEYNGISRVEFNEDGSFKLIRDEKSVDVAWPSMEYRYAEPLTVNLDKTPSIHMSFVTSEGGGQGVNGFIVYTVAGGAEQTLQLSLIAGNDVNDFTADTDETYDLKGAFPEGALPEGTTEITITAIRLSIYGDPEQYVVWKALEIVPAETEPEPEPGPEVESLDLTPTAENAVVTVDSEENGSVSYAEDGSLVLTAKAGHFASFTLVYNEGVAAFDATKLNALALNFSSTLPWKFAFGTLSGDWSVNSQTHYAFADLGDFLPRSNDASSVDLRPATKGDISLEAEYLNGKTVSEDGILRVSFVIDAGNSDVDGTFTLKGVTAKALGA